MGHALRDAREEKIMDVEEGRDGYGTCTYGGKNGKDENEYCAWVEKLMEQN